MHLNVFGMFCHGFAAPVCGWRFASPEQARGYLSSRQPMASCWDGATGWRTARCGAPSRASKKCSNGVRLDHGGGWTTQYCHLQRGSVTVRKGERVSAVDVLGWTGNSGRSELPHLLFQVERRGRPVDPFSANCNNSILLSADLPRCDASTSGGMQTALWSASEHLAHYTAPTIIQRAGLTVEVPEKERAIYDGYPGAASATALALVGYTARSRARSSRPLSPDQTAISSSRSGVRSTKTGHHIFPMPVSTASRRYDHRASIVRSSPSPERH